MKNTAKYFCLLSGIINLAESYIHFSNAYWMKTLSLPTNSQILYCILPNGLPDNAVWFKNNKKLDVDNLFPRVTSDLKYKENTKFFILVFHSVLQSDAGVYQCLLSRSSQQILSSKVYLDANDKISSQTFEIKKRVKRSTNKKPESNRTPEMPKILDVIQKSPNDVDLVIFNTPHGDTAISSCVAELSKFFNPGYLPAVIQQSFSDNIISISHLHSHSQYRAFVECTNAQGSSSRSAPFIFETLPEVPSIKPTIINVTRRNDSIVLLHWTSVSTDVVSYYQVLFSTTQFEQLVKINASCCTAKVRAQDSVSYSIYVSACNPSGCGLPSNPIPLMSDKPFVAVTTIADVTAAATKHSHDVHSSNEVNFVIVGLVAGICLIVGTALYYVIKNRRQKKKSITMQQENVLFERNSSTLRSANDYYTPMSPQGSISIANKLREKLGEVLIEKENLAIGKLLGEGEFGYVYKGKLTFLDSDGNEETASDVAIKCIKTLYRTADETEALVNEGLRMKELNHPNVMGLIGMCLSSFTHVSEPQTNESSPLVVLPFLPNGDLRNHLFLSRTSDTVNQFTLRKLIQFALDIAKGMEYLANHKFVHRDLAARNCMLTKDFSVVVSDFGLSRKLYEQNYYRQAHITKLPVKWMSIESLGDNIFNSRTDVWSFGITFWEILTFCQAPYPGVANHEMYNYLKSGMRLNKPAHCSQELWHTLVFPCWSPQANQRITFSELVVRIEKFLKKADSELSAPITIFQSSDASSSGYEEPIPVLSHHYKLAEENDTNANSPLINNISDDKTSETSSNIVCL